MTTATNPSSLTGFHASPTAQRADELTRALFDAINRDDVKGIDVVLARGFLSYDVHGTRSRTGWKRYLAALRQSFADIRFEVHENIGVLAEDDLVAVRTIVTGTHTGDFAGNPATGKTIQTSASHIFRVRDDQLVEHWLVVDTYRILAGIGAIPGVANAFQQILGVEESPGGLFEERPGTDFAVVTGRATSREVARAAVRRLYDGVISSGRTDEVEMVTHGYIQNSGWTPDGRGAFASAIAVSRGAMPDGEALQTHVVAEGDRIASRSIWDGTVGEAGRPADFTSLDFFRLEDGLIAEHWETVDWIRLYQSFAMLPEGLRDN